MKEKHSDKNMKRNSELVRFSWGGKTHEWEEEADQIMNYLQDKLDDKESKDEKEKKTQELTRKHYW